MESSDLSTFYRKKWIQGVCWSTTMFLFVWTLTLSIRTEALQLIGGNMTVGQGGTVVLPCKLTDTTDKLNQISWQRKTRGKPKNENFFIILRNGGPKFVNGDDERFKFVGSMDNNIGSLQLSNVKLEDEGIYTCIFTLFPSGNHETEIPLNVLVPPVSSLDDNHPTLGNEEVSLVTCTAAGSRPPAAVRWDVGTLEGKVRVITTSIEHDNGTTTTTSSLYGVPTKDINHHLVQCVVTNPALEKEETLHFTIQVYFPPMAVNVRELQHDLFECVTEANPAAEFTWTRSDNSSLLSNVKVEGATLKFLSSTVKDLYQCQASNLYGTAHGYLYVHVSSGGCTACWTILGLLFFLGAVAAIWYLYSLGVFQRAGLCICREGQAVPTSSGEVPEASL